VSKKGQPGCRRRNSISEQFSARTISMMESPAFRVLSLSARRVLDRIEIEHAHHGGHDNGALPVTYDDFVRYGVHRRRVAPAIRELEALGIIRVIRGCGGNADFRMPSKFTLTNRQTEEGAKPTDDWKKIQTIEEAEALACAARPLVKRAKSKTVNRCPLVTRFSATRGQRKQKNPMPLGGTTGPVYKGALLSISRGGGSAPAPSPLPENHPTVVVDISPLAVVSRENANFVAGIPGRPIADGKISKILCGPK
jgi:hypothetical protein